MKFTPPTPVIETTMFSRDSSTQGYYTIAQLEQVRREAIEEWAKVCEDESCSCCWTEDATELAAHLQDKILALKE